MDIKVLLPSSHIICGLDAGLSRDELFRILAQPLVDDGIVTDAEAFAEALGRREDDMTTQVPGGAAMPHASAQCVKRLGLVIGVADEPGIEFSPDSTEKCRVFFLMSVPSGAPAAHLQLLSYLAKFIGTKNKLDNLKKAAEPAAVLKLMPKS